MRKKSIGKWTKEAVIAEAKKYDSKKEWECNSASSYNAALRNGWIKEASVHMKRPTVHNKKWTKEAVIAEAKKYDSKKEWECNSTGSFLAAYRNGWIEEASTHMLRYRAIRGPEKEILDLVRQYYPNAKTKRFPNKNDIFSFKRMEIDVYIPELRKGIEFDGFYWHQPNVLAKHRKKWKKEEIENYHETKDLFFKINGIEILHVPENKWNSDRDSCIQAILMFIGVY